jgi:hypothetical protein
VIPHVKPKRRRCTHWTYEMNCEDFDALRRRAGDRCEICRVLGEDTPHGMLHIDHDYKLGNRGVRGLLCSRCNTGLDLASVVPRDARSRYLAQPFHAVLERARPDGPPTKSELADELRKAARLRRASSQRDQPSRHRFRTAVVNALLSGMSQIDVVCVTGYTRSSIYLIARDGGVPPMRPAPVVRKRLAAEG